MPVVIVYASRYLYGDRHHHHRMNAAIRTYADKYHGCYRWDWARDMRSIKKLCSKFHYPGIMGKRAATISAQNGIQMFRKHSVHLRLIALYRFGILGRLSSSRYSNAFVEYVYLANTLVNWSTPIEFIELFGFENCIRCYWFNVFLSERIARNQCIFMCIYECNNRSILWSNEASPKTIRKYLEHFALE